MVIVGRAKYAFGDIQSVLKLLQLRSICFKQRYFLLYKKIFGTALVYL